MIWCLVVPALALNPSSRRKLKRACDGRVSEQRACKRRGAPSLHHGAWTAVAVTLFSFLTTTSIVYSDFFKKCLTIRILNLSMSFICLEQFFGVWKCYLYI